jgi:Carboxypeptidase regulatory-like domain
MGPTRYFAIAIFTIAMLVLGTRLVSAQPQPQQGYGAGGGEIVGFVYGFNYDDALLPIAWAPVYANNGRNTFVAYSSGGGYYDMFVPQGTYNVTVTQPGYVPYSSVVSVSPGSASTINFYLEESHVPVPEFPSGMISVTAVLAIAAVLIAAKRTKRRKK